MAGDFVDGVLVQWGERLFYPGNRVFRANTPRLSSSLTRRAAAIRARIHAIITRRAPQVMVKVTGGGRGMRAIAAHFRYISKSGRLPFEDDRGEVREGWFALGDLAEQWRVGGSRIEGTSHRREAFNILLSMPRGTDPLALQRAAREFAHAELADHRWVMVLHDHQSNPHVHLSVRAEGRHGQRLNPRKADLQRWRETFAEKLRGWGVDAESTRQASRGQVRNFDPLWRLKAKEDGRLRSARPSSKSGTATERSRQEAIVAWAHIARGLENSEDPADRALAASVDRYVQETPFAQAYGRRRDQDVEGPRFNGGREPSRAGGRTPPGPQAQARPSAPTRAERDPGRGR